METGFSGTKPESMMETGVSGMYSHWNYVNIVPDLNCLIKIHLVSEGLLIK